MKFRSAVPFQGNVEVFLAMTDPLEPGESGTYRIEGIDGEVTITPHEDLDWENTSHTWVLVQRDDFLKCLKGTSMDAALWNGRMNSNGDLWAYMLIDGLCLGVNSHNHPV